MTPPLCIDLYCGLGGWSEGFLSEGYHCRGYDIEAHDYRQGGYPGELILRDVRSITGEECKDAAVIVASPPCQEPSYRAMPWSRAKALNAIGPPHNFIDLFNQCFRIQREASAAAGRHIPLVVENVRGAQKWVGRARWRYGSFFLWGDVPALMPSTLAQKVPVYSDPRRNGGKGTHLTCAIENFQNLQESAVGIKQGGDWFGRECESSMSRLYGSKSPKRKAASAQIAKIPFPLAQWIARSYKPQSPLL